MNTVSYTGWKIQERPKFVNKDETDLQQNAQIIWTWSIKRKCRWKRNGKQIPTQTGFQNFKKTNREDLALTKVQTTLTKQHQQRGLKNKYLLHAEHTDFIRLSRSKLQAQLSKHSVFVYLFSHTFNLNLPTELRQSRHSVFSRLQSHTT